MHRFACVRLGCSNLAVAADPLGTDPFVGPDGRPQSNSRRGRRRGCPCTAGHHAALRGKSSSVELGSRRVGEAARPL